MKSKNFLLFLALQSVCIFAFAGCGSSVVIGSLKRYGIDTRLLNDYEIVYEIKGETFTGRAPSYGILSFENEPTDFLQSFTTDKSSGFSSEKNEKLENVIDEDLNEEHSCMEVPVEYYPDWNGEYKWFVSGRLGDLDTLYLVYFTEDLKLLVYETGH